MVEDRAVFDCGDSKTPAELARVAARQAPGIHPEPVRARMRRVLVLRPEPGASATVERARERGLEAVAVPLFEIEPIAWEAPDPAAFDGLLLTSANAVRHAGEQLARLRGLPVMPSARRPPRPRATRASTLPRAAMTASTGCSDRSSRTSSLLHLCGEDRREPVGCAAAHHAIPVYRAKPSRRPTLASDQRRSAGPFAPRRPPLRRAGEGPRIDRHRRDQPRGGGSGRRRLGDASRPLPQPTDDALLALAARLCNNPAPK